MLVMYRHTGFAIMGWSEDLIRTVKPSNNT